MQKLFDFSKAQMQVPEDDERLMIILKIVKEYDYIFEVVDDEFQDHWNFTEYKYSREKGVELIETIDKHGQEWVNLDHCDFKQRITRSHSKRDILIGLDIAFRGHHITIRLGNLNGY